MSLEKKKKIEPKAPLNKDVDKITALDRAQIQELLRDSISNYVSRAKKDIKNTEEAVELLNSYMSEFLHAFIVFAYDLKGNPLCIQYATNQMDADALNTLVNKTLFHNRMND
jgi:hypothetical protein